MRVLPNMEIQVDPARFVGKNFSQEPSVDSKNDDFIMVINGLIAGRVMKTTAPGTSTKWLWTLTGPYLPPELLPSNGHTNSREEAEEDFERKFWEWHRWAGMQKGGVAWYGAEGVHAPAGGRQESGRGPGADGLVQPGGDSGQPGGSQHHKGGRFT